MFSVVNELEEKLVKLSDMADVSYYYVNKDREVAIKLLQGMPVAQLVQEVRAKDAEGWYENGEFNA